MSKIGFGLQIVIFFFVLFLLISAISSLMLVRIKKNEFPLLWNRSLQKARYLMTPGQYVLYETAYRIPVWIKQSKSAKFWLWVYRLSVLTGMAILGLPFILALFGVYLFD